MRRKKLLIPVILLMAVLLGVAAYAGEQLHTADEAYAQGDETYEWIAQQVISEPDASSAAQAAEGSPATAVSAGGEAAQTGTAPASAEADAAPTVPARTVDYAALESINEDAIGWLYCPDTVIDYPVMGADDYEYYLRHLPDGTYNINGSLFLDYGCQRDFSGKMSIIYGHNMKTEKMFGTLVQYKNQSYFDEHPYLYLYTRAQNYRIALLYGAVISADQWGEEGFARDAQTLMAYAAANTTFTSPVAYTGEEQLVVLSTCSYDYEDARYFVVGILEPSTNAAPVSITP